MRHRFLAALWIPALALAVATSKAEADRIRFDGHKLIAVELRDAQALQTFLKLVRDPRADENDTWGINDGLDIENGEWDIWSHGVGMGDVFLRVTGAQLDQLRAAGLSVRIGVDDLQPWVDANYARPDVSGGWYDAYHPLADVWAYMQGLVDAHPTLARIEDIGVSLEGRPLRAIRITGPGDPNTKPGFFFHGGQHAREWINVPVPMYIAEWLLTNYDSNPQAKRLVDEVDWTILMVMNPDGYDYTWTNNRMWRKNRRDNGGGIFGVDLNRNWGYQWGGEGSSSNPQSETYRGPSPFSEPETQVCRDFVLNHPNVAAYMDFHSYSQLIMWPWGYTSQFSPDHSEFDYVGSNMATLLRNVHGVVYRDGPVYTTIYPASGVSVDWNYGANMNDRMILAFTTELRPANEQGGGFLLPPEQIVPTCEENLPTILFMAERILEPVLRIDVLSETPQFVDPSAAVEVEIAVVPRRGQAMDEGTVFYRNAPGDFTELAMTSVGGGRYTAEIPGFPCGDDVEFYFQARATTGDVFTNPPGAPNETFKYQVREVFSIVDYNFEADLSWLEENLGATSGDWQRGVPVNDPNWEYDPASDSDGSGQCYLTQNVMGNTDVDDGAVRVTSHTIDMTRGNILISYDYFLNLTRPQDGTDALLVEIDSNGGAGPWKQLMRHTTNGGLDWRTQVITQADLDRIGVVLTPNMKLRFTANDGERQSIVEAGIDALKIQSVSCGGGITCDDVKKFKAKCKRSKLIVNVIMVDDSHDGESVGIDINGEAVSLEIRGNKAALKRPNQSGPKTVTLTDPAGCFNPRQVDCG